MNDTEIEKEFEKYWKNYRDIEDHASYPNYTEIAAWWLQKLHQRDEKWRKVVEGLKRYTRDMPSTYHNRALDDVINKMKE